MIYCIEVERGGIGEEDMVMHHNFEKEPTREEIIQLIKDEDCGWQDGYCDVDFYKVGD